MKKVFIALAIIGEAIISVLAFIIPKDPYKIIKTMSPIYFDKPLWLCIIIAVSFIYLLLLYWLYKFLEDKFY